MGDGHDHDDEHGHGHGHGHGENPYAGQGSVILDIGGDVGALVVEMPRSMLDVEVEIEPAGASVAGEDHAHRPHVAVVDRPIDGGTVPSLVFPEVAEGRYALFLKGEDDVQMEVDVVGGSVTEAVWPTA